MTIATGERIPSQTLFRLGESGPVSLSTDDFFAGKKIVLIAVPGPFTPTCHEQHVPGYVATAERFFAKGIDAIACVAVSDAFVMDAWGKALGVGDKIAMLSDGNGAFTKAMGMDFDLSVIGLGTRSVRYALYAEDGVVKVLHNEGDHTLKGSAAEAFLASLP